MSADKIGGIVDRRGGVQVQWRARGEHDWRTLVVQRIINCIGPQGDLHRGTWVTFVPRFLWIFLGAPFIERMRGNVALSGAPSAITAAVVGVVLNLAVWFAIHTIFRSVRPFVAGPIHFDLPVAASIDPWALRIALAAIIAMFR